MFFTAETRDSVRPHYRTVWSSCLYAASLYLKQEGFSVKLNSENLPAHSEISESDRFYLLLGE